MLVEKDELEYIPNNWRDRPTCFFGLATGLVGTRLKLWLKVRATARVAPISVNLRSRATARDRPYYTTNRLGKPVYSRGDPCGRPISVKLSRAPRGPASGRRYSTEWIA